MGAVLQFCLTIEVLCHLLQHSKAMDGGPQDSRRDSGISVGVLVLEAGAVLFIVADFTVRINPLSYYQQLCSIVGDSVVGVDGRRGISTLGVIAPDADADSQIGNETICEWAEWTFRRYGLSDHILAPGPGQCRHVIVRRVPELVIRNKLAATTKSEWPAK